MEGDDNYFITKLSIYLHILSYVEAFSRASSPSAAAPFSHTLLIGVLYLMVTAYVTSFFFLFFSLHQLLSNLSSNTPTFIILTHLIFHTFNTVSYSSFSPSPQPSLLFSISSLPSHYLFFFFSQHFPIPHQNNNNQHKVLCFFIHMGFSEKPQVEGGFDSDTNRKWVIAGIALRPPLKPIYTVPVEKEHKEEDDTQEFSTTPTAVESKIPTPFTCPPPPRKPKPSFKCNYRAVVQDFFTPPDLETVFIRHVIDPTQEKI